MSFVFEPAGKAYEALLSLHSVQPAMDMQQAQCYEAKYEQQYPPRGDLRAEDSKIPYHCASTLYRETRIMPQTAVGGIGRTLSEACLGI